MPTALFFQATPKGVIFCLLAHDTRKRVHKLFQIYLVCYFIFSQLISYVLLYLLFVASHCVYEIFSCPKMSISILIFQICMSIKYHQRTLSFQIPHKLCHTYVWWYFHQHVYVVWACFCFDYINFFLFT